MSTVNSYKHQLEVVAATSILAEKYKKLTLTLVGGFDSKYGKKVFREIEKTNRVHQRKVVSYAGKVPFDELPGIYQEADIFVFASSCENLPNILLESMASSLPIVCSKCPPMPDVLMGAGLYCDVRCPKSIANEIEEYLRSDELKREKAMSAYSVASSYSWKETSQLTFQMLNQLV